MPEGLLSSSYDRGLLPGSEDPSVVYRANILPLLKRYITDPYDDISEYEQIEFAVPSRIRDSFLGMNTLGAMALGDIPFNPDEVTQTALDVGLLSTPLGLMGGVPRGAVLGANVGGRTLLYDAPYSNYKIDPSLPELLKKGTTVKETPDYVPTKIISPEDLASEGYLLNLVGDRTGVGKITRLLGEDLNVPILLDGGMGYMRGKGTGAWASDPNVIRSLSKKVQSAEGKPVYGSYSAMSGTASDFANMTRNVALRNFDPKDLRKKDIKNFNERFKKQKESEKLTKDFPGLDSPELDVWLNKSGTRRAALFKFMDKAEWRDKGFPNITQARYAIQDPLLRDLPSGVEQYGGQSIARMDASGIQKPTSELSMPHGTYSVDLGGNYLGGLKKAVPRSVLFPEWYNLRRQSGSPMASDNRAFQMTPVLQPTNDEWLSGVMKFLESNQ